MSKKQGLDYFALAEKLKIRLLQGPMTAKEGIQLLAPISQQAFSKLIGKLVELTGDDLVQMGKARKTCYALKREVSGCQTPLSLFEIDQKGKPHRIAELIPIHPKGFHAKFALEKEQYFEDLPYFLEDLRPSGFLGRLIPHQYPQENYPGDIRIWSSDHTLSYLSKYAWNPVGNLIIGETALHLFIEKSVKERKVLLELEKKTQYLRFANDVIALGEAGSSAAGEQPKFLCEIQCKKGGSQSVLVKFSPNEKSRLSRRRSDLLICEHLVHRILNENDYPAVRSEILFADQRTFLEEHRFDRIEKNGRLGVISLKALDSEFIGSVDGSWSAICSKLMQKKLISEPLFQRVKEVELFGSLIGNIDMHTGNLSFYTADLRTSEIKPLRLVPVYDMLPMLYAPQNENMTERTFKPIVPRADQSREWRKIYPIVLQYWKNICVCQKISEEFKRIARSHLQELEKLKQVFKFLP